MTGDHDALRFVTFSHADYGIQSSVGTKIRAVAYQLFPKQSLGVLTLYVVRRILGKAQTTNYVIYMYSKTTLLTKQKLPRQPRTEK